MSRTRLFTLLTACFLVVSAAWADDLGYVDCASHTEGVQLFGKARQTPDVLGTVVCGERFTILVYGFVFSRVQTKDGKIGYIYSNLITPDRGGINDSQSAASLPARSAPTAVTPAPAMASSAQPSASAKMNSAPAYASTPDKPAAQTGPLFPTPPVPAVTPSDTSSAPGPSSTANIQTPAATTAPATPAPSQPSSPAQADSQSPSAAAPPTSSSSTPPQPSSPAPPGPLFPNPPQPAPPALPSGAAEAAPVPAPAADPASPQEAAEPRPDPVRSAGVRSSWERPLPSVHQSFLVELYSGYAFDRVSSAGTSGNLNGGMGSFGYNLKPWLQIVGDTSYNVVSSGGVKNALYGNHFGGRFFYHWNRWGMTPFAEGLVGGSRFDVTVSGTNGYKTSDNCISYKAGGGIDIRVNKHWEIRVIDVDYYRTSFGSTTQNNYWASAGVALRLFGSGASE